MKNYKYGIEKLGRENFLKCRIAFRKELNELVVNIKRFKSNKKRKNDFYFESKVKSHYYIGEAWFDYTLHRMSYDARILNIILGLFNCTSIEKIDNGILSKLYNNEKYIEKFLIKIITDNVSRVIDEK